MSYINNIETPQGSQYDIHSVGIPSGEVDSTSTSTVFTATIPGITELTEGVCILLRNGVVTSAADFTLNVNGLGAKPCYNNMATGNETTPTAATRDTTIFNINYTMLFVYTELIYNVTGGAWICYRGYDSNSNTIGYQIRTNSSTRQVSGATYRYRLLFSAADDKKWVPSNTESSTNATASRTVNQTPINPFGEIIYYSSTSAVSANSNISATAIWQQYTLTLGYSFNRTGKALTLTYPGPVYIKCSPQTDGSAIMDSTTPYVQTLPSSDDGYIYIYLGRAYSATAIELVLQHPVFYHDGNGIRVWTGTKIPTKTSDLINDSGFITSADVPEGSVASTTVPKMDGTAAVGTESAFARGDHVHPTDTTRASTATFSTSANGLVPKPASAATNSYLNSSGTWTTPPNTTYALATTAANGLMSTADKTNLNTALTDVILTGSSTASGYNLNVQTYNRLTVENDDVVIPQASSASYGVVKPDGTASHYLNGTGGWTAPPNTTYSTFTSTTDGLVPKSNNSNGLGYYLSGYGTWRTVPQVESFSGTTASNEYNIVLNKVNDSGVEANSTVSIPLATTSSAGLIKPNGDITMYYNGAGGWSIPASGGGGSTVSFSYDADYAKYTISIDGSDHDWYEEVISANIYGSSGSYTTSSAVYFILQNILFKNAGSKGAIIRIFDSTESTIVRQMAFVTDVVMTGQTSGYIDAISITSDNILHKYTISVDLSNFTSSVTQSTADLNKLQVFSTSLDGLVPHPASASTASLLNSSGTWTTLPSSVSEFTNDAGYITGMTILSYGSSTWNDFISAYNANKVVYTRASSAADPASGSQSRLAFMAYVNNATTPSCVEFQYYRSVDTHTASQQGDQVFVYTLKNNGTWTVSTREASVKVVAGSNMVSTYSNNTITLNVNTFSTSANGLVPKPSSASTNSYLNSCGTWTSPSSLPSVSASDNGKVLTVVNGAWAAASLPVYEGGIRQ